MEKEKEMRYYAVSNIIFNKYRNFFALYIQPYKITFRVINDNVVIYYEQNFSSVASV
jgi:hypothetical protein